MRHPDTKTVAPGEPHPPHPSYNQQSELIIRLTVCAGQKGHSRMKCPIDGSELRITDRQGIEIDYCPQCRGVWLDRGELDKILERSAVALGGRDRDDDDDDYDDRRRDEFRRDDDYRQPTGAYKKKKKRGGFLEDLFDFG